MVSNTYTDVVHHPLHSSFRILYFFYSITVILTGEARIGLAELNKFSEGTTTFSDIFLDDHRSCSSRLLVFCDTIQTGDNMCISLLHIKQQDMTTGDILKFLPMNTQSSSHRVILCSLEIETSHSC